MRSGSVSPVLESRVPGLSSTDPSSLHVDGHQQDHAERSQLQYLAELGKLVEPLKGENVRLTRSLKYIRAVLQELVSTMRKFFSSPERREWFRELKDDDELVRFFQQLIDWYKRISDHDKDPMFLFYRRLWEFERGAMEEGGDDGIWGSDTRSSKSDPRSPSRQSSEQLYDACHARTESMLLAQENRRLKEENLDLRRQLAGEGTDEVDELSFASPKRAAPHWVGVSSATGSRSKPPEAKQEQSLAELVSADARWQRLLNDESGMFTGSDTIDETYREYLSDVLDQMEKHDCCFKKGVEVSAAIQVSRRDRDERR